MQQTVIQRNREILKSLFHKKNTMEEFKENLPKVLNLFDYKDLRENQRDPINHLFSGKDLLLIMPTSAGKSACYIIPALCMGYKTVIFSPLISLIKDQSNKLKERGIRVGVINSSVSPSEKSAAMARWVNGDIDFLFVAPERLSNQEFLDCMKERNPDFVVVDEIHCASEYGDSFRPNYSQIAPFIKQFTPKLFLGLTATVSEDVFEDIINIFDLHNTPVMVRTFKRKNLIYKTHIYDGGESKDTINFRLLSELNKEPLVPTIVYCSTVKMCEELYLTLGSSIKGGSVVYFGTGLSQGEREINQTAFIEDRTRVVFATNSFGLGVDKPNIGKVIFRTIPSSLEELIQGFGRGGRNGCRCDCIYYADFSTASIQDMFLEQKYPPESTVRSFFAVCKRLAGEDGYVYSTLSEICKRAQIFEGFGGSCMNILKKYDVLGRGEKSSIAKIRFLEKPDEDKTSGKKGRMTYREAIEFVGIDNPKQHVLEVDLEYLSETMGVSLNTIKLNLKKLKENGSIYYEPPFPREPIIIKGDINKVDFAYLRKKALDKATKIEEVKAFAYLEDEKKAEFADKYFQRQSRNLGKAKENGESNKQSTT